MGQVARTDDAVPAVLRVGPWVIETQARRVTSPSGSSRLEPKAMGVLLQLAARPGEVVDRQTLLSAVWGAEMATDDVLSRAISELRRALGADRRHPRLVETVRGSGYRLLVPVEPRPASDDIARGLPLPDAESDPARHARGRSGGRGRGGGGDARRAPVARRPRRAAGHAGQTIDHAARRRERAEPVAGRDADRVRLAG